MSKQIGVAILIFFCALVVLIVMKNQKQRSPIIEGCPPGTSQVLLTDGTVSCATVNLDKIGDQERAE